jgi:tetratricopeptide (TPR) repeat protein
MRGVRVTRQSRLAALACSLAALAIGAACQAGLTTPESFAQGTRAAPARPLPPFRALQDCFRTDRNFAADPARVVSVCGGEVNSPGLGNRKNNEIAALHLNVGSAYLALARSDPSNAPTAQTILRRGMDAGSQFVDPQIVAAMRTALAESYLYSTAIEDLDRALVLIGPQPASLAERRLLARIYESKVKRPGPQLEQDLGNWLVSSRRFRDMASGAGTPPDIAQEAGSLVVRASTALGDYWLARAEETRGNASRRDEAILALQRGVSALQESPDPAVLVRLGQAQLQLAGLQGPALSTEYACEAGKASRQTLEQARSAFRSASGELARSGEGCALQALGLIDEAVRQFESAVRESEGKPSEGDRRFELARVQRISGQLSAATANFDKARSLFLAPPSDPRNGEKIAQVYFALGELRSASPATVAQAHCDYEAAISANPNFARAYVEHGRFHYLQASKKWSSQVEGVCPNRSSALPPESTNSRHADVALENLAIAEQKSQATGDSASLADARLFMSKVLTERGEGSYFDRQGRSSIQIADLAVTAGSGAWAYREQACLARIRVGGRELLQSTDTTRFCTELSPNTPQNNALRGMYNLRMAQYYDSRNPGENYTRTLLLQNARDSFRTGRTLLQPATADERALQAMLAIGEGLVLRCSNLGDTDIVEAIKQFDPASVQAATNRINDYGIQSCR